MLLATYFVGLILIIKVSLAQNSAQDYLDAHNKVRTEVGVGPMTWDDTLAAYAEKCSNSMVDKCILRHSMGRYGENIAIGFGDYFTGMDAVEMWAAEKPYYDYESNSCVGKQCVHYAQIVWSTSLHGGYARSQCNNGWVFITCSYDPPGNIEGCLPY